MSQSCRDRPRARTQAPNDRKNNDCGQRCYFGRAIVPALAHSIVASRYRTETALQGAQPVLRTWAATNGIGGGKIVPSRSLAEESVKRLGLIQVHSFRLQNFRMSL
jgi:hypothetical protein